jgi:hypothetical protein
MEAGFLSLFFPTFAVHFAVLCGFFALFALKISAETAKRAKDYAKFRKETQSFESNFVVALRPRFANTLGFFIMPTRNSILLDPSGVPLCLK